MNQPQPPPYDPNYGQQPQQPAPEYGQQPGYGPPPGGQLPPPAYPMPQPGFGQPPRLGGPGKPGAVGGLMAILLVLAGLTLGSIVLAIIDHVEFGHYRYPDGSLWGLNWYFSIGLDVVKLIALVLAGVMVAGGKDGARVFGAFIAGAVFQGAIGTVVSLAISYFEYERATFLGVLAFLFSLLLVAGSVLAVILAVGRAVSRWFAESVLGRTG